MDDKLPVKTYVPQNFVRIWYIGIFNSDDVITVHVSYEAYDASY